MVKAICELTGLPFAYMGMPSAAYQVGPITVSRDGSIDCEDETMLSTLKPMLIERGWLEVEALDAMPVATESAADSKDMPETVETINAEQMVIIMPISGWTVAQLTNLLRMLCNKQILINRMLGCDMLSIEEWILQFLAIIQELKAVGRKSAAASLARLREKRQEDFAGPVPVLNVHRIIAIFLCKGDDIPAADRETIRPTYYKNISNYLIGLSAG